MTSKSYRKKKIKNTMLHNNIYIYIYIYREREREREREECTNISGGMVWSLLVLWLILHNIFLFIHACIKKLRRAQFSIDAAVCVRLRTSDVCAENFSHSARLLLQQSRASFMLALCLMWTVPK